jgi:predicted DNA-binding protein
MLDDETYERLEALSERSGRPIDELVKAWTESAVLAAGLIRNLDERDARVAELKAREQAARAKVTGFSVKDNVSRDQLYRD